MAALLAVWLLLATGCRQGPDRLEGQNLVVLQGATLIDGTGAAPRPSSAVVIDGSRILRVGEVDDFRYPDETMVVDLAGRWLVPGFMDLHAHTNVSAGSLTAEVLGTLLQFGITTFRNPAATPETGTELRDRIAAGEILGPRMFTAGPLIDLPRGATLPRLAVAVSTPEEIRAEVRRQAEAGVDFVKFRNHLSPEMIRTGIEEAHAVRVRVIGHLGRTGWADAARYGIDSVVHSGVAAPTWELVAPEERARFFNFWVPSPDFDPTLFSDWQAATDLELQMAALTSALVENRVEVNPTLVMMEAIYWGDDRALLEELEPDYAPASIAATWRKEPHFSAAWPDEARAAAKETFPLTLQMVRRLHEAGVLLTAGTDLGNPWITPGVSLHREMWLLNRAGIPALEVLTIATRNGAEALGILDQVGTIESGKRADLVVLAADPLDDIRNTRAIEAVYLGGQRITPARAR